MKKEEIKLPDVGLEYVVQIPHLDDDPRCKRERTHVISYGILPAGWIPVLNPVFKYPSEVHPALPHGFEPEPTAYTCERKTIITLDGEWRGYLEQHPDVLNPVLGGWMESYMESHRAELFAFSNFTIYDRESLLEGVVRFYAGEVKKSPVEEKLLQILKSIQAKELKEQFGFDICAQKEHIRTALRREMETRPINMRVSGAGEKEAEKVEASGVAKRLFTKPVSVGYPGIRGVGKGPESKGERRRENE